MESYHNDINYHMTLNTIFSVVWVKIRVRKSDPSKWSLDSLFNVTCGFNSVTCDPKRIFEWCVVKRGYENKHQKWPYMSLPSPPPPLLCWLLCLEWLIISKHVVQSFFLTYFYLVSIFRSMPNHLPLKYRSPSKIRHRIKNIQWGHSLLHTQGSFCS